jgi:plasmid stability protein
VEHLPPVERERAEILRQVELSAEDARADGRLAVAEGVPVDLSVLSEPSDTGRAPSRKVATQPQ